MMTTGGIAIIQRTITRRRSLTTTLGIQQRIAGVHGMLPISTASALKPITTRAAGPITVEDSSSTLRLNIAPDGR